MRREGYFVFEGFLYLKVCYFCTKGENLLHCFCIVMFSVKIEAKNEYTTCAYTGIVQ